jgi:seryl-tRNA synthetase
MLDLRTVRDDPEGVKAALAKRGPGAAEQVDRLLEADAARRRLVGEVDALRAEQKRRGREVAKAAPGQRERVLAGLKELSDRLAEAEGRLRAAEAELAEVLARVPNLADLAAPAGGEEDSVELRRVGTPPRFDFAVRDHLELGELLGAIDTARRPRCPGPASAI